ncbi:MAG TPA: MBG domain-containing protein [Bryobacteraceae bacterium]|nr:MBG domain-containing protein [Bryobacteraceae bacterium]
MRRINRRLTLFAASLLAGSALAHSALAQSINYLVTVNTTSLNGQTGTIDLQFNAGALSTENACVTIGNFSTDGTLPASPAPTTTGSVMGTLATTLTINNGTSGCSAPPVTYTASTLNDYNQSITFGNTLSFYLSLSGPAVTNPNPATYNSASSFGLAFTAGGSPALTSDITNFSGLVTLNTDGTTTPAPLSGPGNTASLVTIQPAELVTVGTSTSGLPFTVDGNSTPYTSNQTFAWAIGSQHTLVAGPPQPSSGTLYTFTQWSDGTTNATDAITVATGTTSYTANYSASYLLTTAASPSADGTVSASASVSGNNGYYPSGTVVNLNATPNSGYVFSSWTGSVANANSASTTITMNAPQNVTATFVAGTVQMTVGTSPAGLSFSVDGTTYTSTQVLTWTIGTQHTIATTSPQTAPGTSYTFSNWSDSGAISHNVTAPMTAATYTATFSTQYQLTTAVSPSGAGTVTPASGGYYAAGTVVNLKASPNSGYVFLSWTGSVVNANSASTAITMSAPQNVTANFAATAIITLGNLSQTYTGSPLSATATTTPANLPVTFTYNGSATPPTSAGSYAVVATIPSGGNYTGSASGTLVISKATPVVTWATPAAITYGTPLSGAQLNATANIQGIFAYNPVIGSILNAGSPTLAVTFTPTDSTDYKAATGSVILTIKQASQIITFGSIASQTAGGSVSLNATASSGLAVSLASLTPTVCSVSGTTATLLVAGACTLQASQAGNNNYAMATPVTQSFTVAPAPNFTITPTPSSETVNRGVVGAFILELKSVNGFKGKVQLSCAGGPSGSYCVDMPQTIQVNGTACGVSGIFFPKSASAGTYIITFTGVSGSLKNTATAKFTVK